MGDHDRPDDVATRPPARDYARLMRDALVELKQLRATVDELRLAQREPIAIIGMSCRFPGGVRDPEGFWRLLHEGVDAIGEVPPDRWDAASYYDADPDAPGRMSTSSGGFLDNVDEFDPAFFGISPREARSLDPQQRLLLEVSWEALERAGVSPARLYGTPAGVFIGMSTFDYALHQVGGVVSEDDLRRLDGYAATGATMSPAAGRLSYVLGLTGPSMVVDTACSSSLVAIHLAMTSLRNRECDLALVGGVNLILRPEWNVNFSKARMLAPDGRCKTFDASADGYSRGEGCGVIVLQRLSDAAAARRRIVAVVRGSAVNQDGASGGLTVPNGPSQERVIRRALDTAGVGPANVSYVEAHGTGTSLGDPIEVAALGAVFGAGRSKDAPLAIGSVKTNVGHLEAAAGIAGLMKVALSLERREIPPHLHFTRGNPMIDWAGLPLVVPTRPMPWTSGDSPRRAGVSSFGFTGTNAHVVLEEAPVNAGSAAPFDEQDPAYVPTGSAALVGERDPAYVHAGSAAPFAERDPAYGPSRHVLAISARTATALRELARKYEDHFTRHPDLALSDVAFTTTAGRSHFAHRLAVVAGSLAEAREQLAAYLAGQPAHGVVTDPNVGRVPRSASGQRERTRRDEHPDNGTAAGDGDETLEHLAERYVRGDDIDWDAFHTNSSARPVELPTYPFERQRYWIDIDRGSPAGSAAPFAERNPAHVLAGSAASFVQRDPAYVSGTAERDPAYVRDCMYALTWAERAHAERGDAVPPSGRWLILGDRGSLGVELARHLRAAGVSCALLPPGSAVGDLTGVERIISLHALDVAPEPNLSDDARFGNATESALRTVRTIATSDSRQPPSVWLVTRGAVAVGHETPESAVSLTQAALWGFGRSVALELPEIWGGLIDLDAAGHVELDAQALAAELLSSTGEDQVAFRSRRRYVPRLARRMDAPHRELALDSHGTYLVAGGLGTLGLHAAKWLVSRGARTLVLATRRGTATPGAAQAVAALEDMGTRVVVAAADIAREADVDRLLAGINASGAPLRGIVHAAGVDARTPVSEMTPDDLESMLASKTQGAWLLHDRTRHLALDLFVCFSSVSAIWGSPRRAHYAAANAFLDALVRERRRRGLPALTVNWGPWLGGGLAGDEELDELARSGNLGLDPALALRALDEAASAGDAQVIVARVDWPRFRSTFEARRSRPLFADVWAHTAPESRQTGALDADWLERLAPLAGEDRAAALGDLLRAEVARVLGFDRPEDVDVDRSVFDLGMDSLRAVELSVRLQRHLGLERPVPFFDCPQVRALTDRLLDSGTVGHALAARHTADGDDEIIAFARRAWPDRSEETLAARWRWMFVDSARRRGLDPSVWLHREAGEVVAHHAAIPVELKAGADTVDAAWFADTMVLEPHRESAVGARLIVESNDAFSVGLSLGQTAQMRRIALQLGWHDVAPLQTYLLPLRPGRVLGDKLGPLVAGVADVGLNARQFLKRRLSGRYAPLDVQAVDRFDAGHDRLWASVREDYPCAVTRDASYLNWKYVDQPGQHFLRLEVLKGREVAAVAVLALDDPGIIYRYRRAFIVDLVVPSSDSRLVLGVLHAIRTCCADSDVDAMVFHVINEALERHARAYGFIRRQPTRFLLVNPLRVSADARRRLLAPSQWLVTMGDSDIDRPWEADGRRVQRRTGTFRGTLAPGASAV